MCYCGDAQAVEQLHTQAPRILVQQQQQQLLVLLERSAEADS